PGEGPGARHPRRAAERGTVCRDVRSPRRSTRPRLFLDQAGPELSRAAPRQRRYGPRRELHHGDAAAIQSHARGHASKDERLALGTVTIKVEGLEWKWARYYLRM